MNPQTADQLPLGTIVKFREPMDADEAASRFRIEEHRGARVLVSAANPEFDKWQLRPTFVYQAADMVAAGDVPSLS